MDKLKTIVLSFLREKEDDNGTYDTNDNIDNRHCIADYIYIIKK